MEKFRLRARWGPRKETVQNCARQMLVFLHGLASCDKIFDCGWLKCTESIHKAKENDLDRVEVSIGHLERLLSSQRVRRESDKAVIPELGFMPGRLWNGSEDDAAFVFIQCGAYANAHTMPALNTVWVEFPSNGITDDRILHPEKLRRVLEVVVESWDPDWARISTDKMDAEVYQENPYNGQMVGWFTYVSSRYGRLPILPEGYTTSRVDNLGSLIFIALSENITVSNPKHIAVVRKLSEILGCVGLLAPVPPKLKK